MKSLLERKRESIQLVKPSVDWENLYIGISKLLESWGIDPDSVDTSGFINQTSGLIDFEPKFIELYIKKALGIPQDNPLWRDILRVELLNEEPKSYHGSAASTTISTWGLVIRDKNEILKNISGNWVYNNISEVSDFMDVYKNTIYMRLVEIRRLFPIKVED